MLEATAKQTRSKRKQVIRRKMSRLNASRRIRTLDLFSGCGGLSLGFQAAGFEIVGAIDNDSLAAASHAANFHPDASLALVERHSQARDLTSVSASQIVDELNLGRSVHNSIDVLIGGPPCQAFARVGRAKLREIDEHPEAFLRDQRANLYLQYLDFVRELCPLALLMENVPDALNYGGHNIGEEVCEVLDQEGYDCAYTTLNAAYYGVPQMRERMFLLALRKEFKSQVWFPEPTHFVELPAGYQGTRAVALKSIRDRQRNGEQQLGIFSTYYREPPSASSDLPPAITAEEALADLPTITAHLSGGLKRGPRRFDRVVPYPAGGSLTPFARLMRGWPSFEQREGIADHVIRSLPRDYQIFRRMKPGDQYPQAHALALRILDERIRALARQGCVVQPGTTEYEALKKSIVPPYDPSKFPNKWRKMEPNRPARTLLAHLGKDSYSHIHYDSKQARTISVREAARLQSFPDGFRFRGTMNPAFRQIGNAVPPLLANALAHTLLEMIECEATEASLADHL